MTTRRAGSGKGKGKGIDGPAVRVVVLGSFVPCLRSETWGTRIGGFDGDSDVSGREKQIPPLRCGMTTRRADNGKGKGKGKGKGNGNGNSNSNSNGNSNGNRRSRFLRFAAE